MEMDTTRRIHAWIDKIDDTPTRVATELLFDQIIVLENQIKELETRNKPQVQVPKLTFRKTNLNNKVRFKLFPDGERIWREHWKPYCVPNDDPLSMIKPDANGWRTTQLWELMHVFGAHSFAGVTTDLETVIEMETE